MEAVLKNGEEVAENFQCEEGAFVFFSTTEGGEFYKEWSDLTPMEAAKFIAVRDSLKESISSLLRELSHSISFEPQVVLQ
jgi:hypothetical protein